MRYLLPLAVATTLLLSACGTAPTDAAPAAFALTSPDVAADGTVPDWAIGSFGAYCDGENRSIALQWSSTPGGTESFAVSMIDGTYVHWVVTDIPATATGLASMPDGVLGEGTVGASIAGSGGYVGPCVDGHEYVYTVYALDSALGGTEQTSWSMAESLMDGHVLASASLTTRRPADS
jgi:Raf kinase inhibitor-like YbhB/YbcL family protein